MTKSEKEKSTPPSSDIEDFSKIAFSLHVDSFSKEPVKTKFGYHVIYIEEKKKAITSTYKDREAKREKHFKKEAVKIENHLKIQKLRTILEELTTKLKAKATIEYVEFINFDKLLEFNTDIKYNYKSYNISFVLELDFII